MSAAEVLAEALRRDGWTCEYHEPEDRGVCGGCDEAHDRTAAHQLDALKAAGYELVELPKATPPSYKWVDSDGNPDWAAHADSARQALWDMLADQYWITLAEDGIRVVNIPEGCTPRQAREFAAALLAAANDADVSS